MAETRNAVLSGQCMEPRCRRVGARQFTASKPDKESLTFRFCAEHVMPAAFGLIRFGIYDQIDHFSGSSATTTTRGANNAG